MSLPKGQPRVSTGTSSILTFLPLLRSYYLKFILSDPIYGDPRPLSSVLVLRECHDYDDHGGIPLLPCRHRETTIRRS